jgi:hypothetical protein
MDRSSFAEGGAGRANRVALRDGTILLQSVGSLVPTVLDRGAEPREAAPGRGRSPFGKSFPERQSVSEHPEPCRDIRAEDRVCGFGCRQVGDRDRRTYPTSAMQPDHVRLCVRHSTCPNFRCQSGLTDKNLFVRKTFVWRTEPRLSAKKLNLPVFQLISPRSMAQRIDLTCFP